MPSPGPTPDPETLEALEQRLQDHYRSRLHPDAWQRVDAALDAARAAHREQVLPGGGETPFLVHPISTALILAVEARCHDATVLSAALLHDVLEGTVLTADVLGWLVGPAVSEQVVMLSGREEADFVRVSGAAAPVRLVKVAAALDHARRMATFPDGDERRSRAVALGQRWLPVAGGIDAGLGASLRTQLLALGALTDGGEGTASPPFA
jgi:(p)ppGpp synthase/HD superfamily hydrolase